MKWLIGVLRPALLAAIPAALGAAVDTGLLDGRLGQALVAAATGVAAALSGS